jgi:hypothetical protein
LNWTNSESNRSGGHVWRVSDVSKLKTTTLIEIFSIKTEVC